MMIELFFVFTVLTTCVIKYYGSKCIYAHKYKWVKVKLKKSE